MIGDNMTVVSGAHTERTIPLSKTKSVFGDDGLMKVPELPPESKLLGSDCYGSLFFLQHWGNCLFIVNCFSG